LIKNIQSSLCARIQMLITNTDAAGHAIKPNGMLLSSSSGDEQRAQLCRQTERIESLRTQQGAVHRTRQGNPAPAFKRERIVKMDAAALAACRIENAAEQRKRLRIAAAAIDRKHLPASRIRHEHTIRFAKDLVKPASIVRQPHRAYTRPAAAYTQGHQGL